MFTFNSTRGTSGSSSLSKELYARIPQRQDLANQQAANRAHHELAAKDQVDAWSAEATTLLWSNKNSTAFAVKAILHDAKQRDIARAMKNEGPIARINSGWRTIFDKVDELLAANNGSGAGASTSHTELLDTISVLGVHFPDLPSCAYGRRPQAILDMYYRYVEGKDISNELKAFDRLHRMDTGREDAESTVKIDIKQLLGQAAAANPGQAQTKPTQAEIDVYHVQLEQNSRAWMKHFQGFHVAAADFEQTPFVAQSRELRQLATLRLVQWGMLAVPQATIEQEEEMQQQQEHETDVSGTTPLSSLASQDDLNLHEETKNNTSASSSPRGDNDNDDDNNEDDISSLHSEITNTNNQETQQHEENSFFASNNEDSSKEQGNANANANDDDDDDEYSNSKNEEENTNETHNADETQKSRVYEQNDEMQLSESKNENANAENTKINNTNNKKVRHHGNPNNHHSNATPTRKNGIKMMMMMNKNKKKQQTQQFKEQRRAALISAAVAAAAASSTPSKNANNNNNNKNNKKSTTTTTSTSAVSSRSASSSSCAARSSSASAATCNNSTNTSIAGNNNTKKTSATASSRVALVVRC